MTTTSKTTYTYTCDRCGGAEDFAEGQTHNVGPAIHWGGSWKRDPDNGMWRNFSGAHADLCLGCYEKFVAFMKDGGMLS
jgi:hypothetical protein